MACDIFQPVGQEGRSAGTFSYATTEVKQRITSKKNVDPDLIAMTLSRNEYEYEYNKKSTPHDARNQRSLRGES